MSHFLRIPSNFLWCNIKQLIFTICWIELTQYLLLFLPLHSSTKISCRYVDLGDLCVLLTSSFYIQTNSLQSNIQYSKNWQIRNILPVIGAWFDLVWEKPEVIQLELHLVHKLLEATKNTDYKVNSSIQRLLLITVIPRYSCKKIW